ncbi:MAG: hypothetical protein HQM14_05695 [SAR324 cluster bacterium]|nr:hypothetical protein [SAR324 cluster bacterium]
MIQQAKLSPTEMVPHTENLKGTLQSLFRFQGDVLPQSLSKIDITSINYINYKRIVETLKHTLSVIKSEVVSIDPSGVKDALFIARLALDRIEYSLNLIDTRQEHLQEYLDSHPTWLRYIKWTRINDAYKRYQQLQDNQHKSREAQDYLTRAYKELRHCIRQSALAIVKTSVSPGDKNYIADIEGLESSHITLQELLQEIEDQLRQTKKSRKILYYASDRTRIFNKLQAAHLVIKNLAFQLNKVHLDQSFITAELMTQVSFSGNKGLRWHISDKYVFHVLCKRQVALSSLIEGLDRQLQPESHKLNMYANCVINLGYLLKYAPTTNTPKISEFSSSFQEQPLPSLAPTIKEKKRQRPRVTPSVPQYKKPVAVEEESILTLDLEEIEDPEIGSAKN